MRSLDELLAGSAWFAELDAPQQSRVRTDLIERSVTAGGFVCRRLEPVDHWLGVIDGLVKISNSSFDGKLVTFTGVPPGGWLGEGSLLKDETRRYDVIAIRDSRVVLMPRATFLWLLDRSIPFNRFLLRQLNERLGQFIAMVEYERLLGPDARVARCLAQMFNPHLYPGIGRQLEISQTELGYLTGLSRQRVNQALQALERQGLLKVDYGSITVLSLAGLRDFDDTN